MKRRGFFGVICSVAALPFAAKSSAPIANVSQEHEIPAVIASEPVFFLGTVRDYGHLRDLWMVTPHDATWTPRDWTVEVKTDNSLRYIECPSIAPNGHVLVDSIAIKRERLVSVRVVPCRTTEQLTDGAIAGFMADPYLKYCELQKADETVLVTRGAREG